MSIYTHLWNIEESIKEDLGDLGDKLRFFVPIAFIVYSACFLDQHISRVFVVTFAISMIIMSLMKGIFNELRPRQDIDDDPHLSLDWSPDEGNSFPSGHAMSAMVGGVFWFEIHWIVGIIGVALGAITCFSRVVVKAHWIRDVLTSSIIAVMLYGIAKYFYL